MQGKTGSGVNGTKGTTTAIAVFGAGCFWGVEETFRNVKGVVRTEVGYAGGTVPNASYDAVCTGRTGHAEVVKVEFDPTQVSYAELLDVFFASHDPTTLNRQGPDLGTQYRSVIFYADDEQKRTALAVKDAQQASGRFQRPIVTEVVPAGLYAKAEDYHQQYFAKRGGGACHI